ncbi:MAG: hypothetical protein ACREEW_01515 [Caulobacteraceae bacterium]
MFKPPSLALAALAAGALVLGASGAQAQPDRHGGVCLRLSSIQNTKLRGERTLYLRSSTRAIYRIEFAHDCATAGTEPLILHPVNNSGVVCGAIGLDVRVRGTGEVCQPSTLTRLTPAEVAAIPPKYRP